MPRGVYVRNEALRPKTYKICEQCGERYGPVDHLSRRFCGMACKVKSQATGRKKFRKTTREARNAQSLLRYHVVKGNIIKPDTCEECGKSKCTIEGAHHDYSRPLDVRWLCISCHRKWDWKEPKGVTLPVLATE